MKIGSQIIEQANKALKSANIVQNEQYDKVFKGYISSFGASVAQAGLLPTVIFFEAESEQASERKKVITALMNLLNQNDWLPNYQKGSLAEYILDNQRSNDHELLTNVTACMVALKLALRMYKEKEPKKDKQ